MTPRFHAAFAVVASVAVAFAVGWGFVLAGSPATRRLERMDERRLQDLQTIAREIQWMVVDPNKKGTLKCRSPSRWRKRPKGRVTRNSIRWTRKRASLINTP